MDVAIEKKIEGLKITLHFDTRVPWGYKEEESGVVYIFAKTPFVFREPSKTWIKSAGDPTPEGVSRTGGGIMLDSSTSFSIDEDNKVATAYIDLPNGRKEELKKLEVTSSYIKSEEQAQFFRELNEIFIHSGESGDIGLSYTIKWLDNKEQFFAFKVKVDPKDIETDKGYNLMLYRADAMTNICREAAQRGFKLLRRNMIPDDVSGNMEKFLEHHLGKSGNHNHNGQGLF